MNLESIKDYTKCIIANRFTLAGALGGPVSLASLINSTNAEMSFASSMILVASTALLIATHYGQFTVRAYRRTKTHINKYDNIDERFVNNLSKWYCDQVGVRLAAKEAGLEHLLPKATIKYIPE